MSEQNIDFGDVEQLSGIKGIRPIGPIEIRQYDYDFNPKPIPGYRYGNDWAEFNLVSGSNTLHDPKILQEPTLDDLGMADAFSEIRGAASLMPSALMQAVELLNVRKLNVPLDYIRSLWKLGMLIVPDYFQYDDPDLNLVPFGDRAYRVEPYNIAGTFANGASSPLFNVYPGSTTLQDINDGTRPEPLITFYASRTPIEAAMITATFLG